MCVYMCVYMCIYVCVYMCIYECIFECTCECICECIYEHIYACVCKCIHVCVWVCLDTYRCIDTDVAICIYMTAQFSIHVYMYMNIYVHCLHFYTYIHVYVTWFLTHWLCMYMYVCILLPCLQPNEPRSEDIYTISHQSDSMFL